MTTTLEILPNIQLLSEANYEQVLDYYLDQIEPNPHVRAVYQIGSIGHPGISDLDLILVVDRVRDPFWLSRLSVHQGEQPDLVRYVFPHDVYVFDVDSFREIQYSLYANNLNLISGQAQDVAPLSNDEERWLSLQIIFDFTASRIAQFKNQFAGGRIDARGILLRVASIKHSLALLRTLGVDLPEVAGFVDRVVQVREEPERWTAHEIQALFLESPAHFSAVVEAASVFFRELILSYHSDVEASSALKLNALQILRFVDGAARWNDLGQDPLTVYYPRAPFYHYLAFTRYDNLIGRRAQSHLAYAGDEVYELHAGYEETLQRRLMAISSHFSFLRENGLHYAMKGNPGFVAAWDHLRTDGPPLSQPGADTRVVGGYAREAAVMTLEEAVRVESVDTVRRGLEVPVRTLDLDRREYEEWVAWCVPDWHERYGDKFYKKPLELFITYKLLDPQPEDVFMDAAGGINTYLHRIDVAKRYMQDISLTEALRNHFGPDLTYVECDAGSIPMPDESLTRISMHHSFEHFQGTSDTDFIREAQRMLRPGGRCCIVPIFLADRYVEVSRQPKAECPFDPDATYLVDPAARLTGGPSCGDFARVYSLEAFDRRVLKAIDRTRFTVTLYEVSLAGRAVPFSDLSCHASIAKVNYPYRALLIERQV